MLVSGYGALFPLQHLFYLTSVTGTVSEQLCRKARIPPCSPPSC